MLGQQRLSLVSADGAHDEIFKQADATSNAAEEVRSELRRVLNSDHFDTSDRNRRFLEYVVLETLAGRHDRIKAYTIATVVFGRDDSFDPALDPVVRMEARRLRRSLEHFYLIEGQKGTVRIALPKGGYVPRFQNPELPANASNAPPPGPVRQTLRVPSILIAAFDTNTDDMNDFCNGLARRIAANLSRVPELALYMQFSGQAALFGNDSAHGKPAVDFVLSGDAALAHDMVGLTAALVHASSGRVVWAQFLASDSARSGLPDPRDKIADLIGAAVLDGLAVATSTERWSPR
ncbi:hypothetical protein [Mesorhizobium marinum]|uniref:hypothetical protein n=1 Tax=Mesorhizobium marinum TaxID=3228790 RepID=UPI003465057B